MHLHPAELPRHAIRIRFTWCAGGVTFLFYLMLVVTGVILMFYYRPDAAHAYTDMKYAQFDIPFAWLMRNMHRYSGHLMVIAIWIHMLRVFMTGSYKPPREFNWVVGVILLVLTMLLSFTGYLLPWDQLSVWAVTVGTNMAGEVPLFGRLLRKLFLGGHQIGDATLLRFYILHCIFIPVIASVFMIVHFWRIRKDGGISGPL